MFHTEGKRGNGMTMKFAWQEKYTEALLELDRSELPRRIDTAEKAIYQRVEELKQADASSAEELWAINDALRGLRALARSECPPRHSLESSAAHSEVGS
jgi:hypothetical protein